jgi:hypothetical protein
MRFMINQLVKDWAWQVNDGMPDPKNRDHLEVLEQTLRDHKYSEDFIHKYISEIEFQNKDSFLKYKSKHKMRPTTAVTIGGKETTAGEADPESKSKKEPDSEKRVISGKDKTLKKGSPSESQEFSRDMEPDDDSFEEKNKANAIPIPPEPLKFSDDLIKNPKFPKRYLKALERMVNTKVTEDTKKWGHFSDIQGGAGQISAQAGELMTMMGSSMSDKEFDKFATTIENHVAEQVKNNPDLKKEGTRIVTKSWIKATKNSRKAILDRVKKQYGEDAEVIGSAWDAKSEVEAMGLSDYEKNKGFSTDMYMKVKTSDGKEILDEISLKKDKNINFLNSGTGDLVNKWDPELAGSSIDPKVYAKNERQRLAKGAKDILSKDMQTKLAKNIDAASEGRGSRSNSKSILKAIKEEAKAGNEKAKKYLEEDDKAHRKMQDDAINEINTNPKVKTELVKEIKNEFPLKAVSEGEETMAIGDMSLDKDTMKDVFGTSDFESLKENLTVKRSEKGEPYLAYAVEGEEDVKVSNIVIRQDGRGYGGSSIKFEMKLHPEMAKRLKEATERVYS